MTLLVAVPAHADELSDAVSEVMDKARQEADRMSIPLNRYQEEGSKAAQEAAKVYHSPEFQERLTCERNRIWNEVRNDAGNEQEGIELEAQKLSNKEQVYLFISSAMPEETIRNYLESSSLVEDQRLIVVMRGFVPRQRGKYLARITKKDAACIDRLRFNQMCARYDVPITLMPSLFERYDIQQVPAVVYDSGTAAWRISGDASLGYLLEKIADEVNSPGVHTMAESLR